LLTGVLALKKVVQLAAICLLSADPLPAVADAAGDEALEAGGLDEPPAGDPPLLPQAATPVTSAHARKIRSDLGVLIVSILQRRAGPAAARAELFPPVS
jgi:hypothetical protein